MKERERDKEREREKTKTEMDVQCYRIKHGDILVVSGRAGSQAFRWNA
jgi:hypothetical protein